MRLPNRETLIYKYEKLQRRSADSFLIPSEKTPLSYSISDTALLALRTNRPAKLDKLKSLHKSIFETSNFLLAAVAKLLTIMSPMTRVSSNFDALRMHHFQFFAMVVVTCFTSFLLYPSKRRMESPSVLYGMLHLGSFGANFGAQLWVTLVAGLTMFYSLPRHMFGKVQSRLFPMFFLWSLVCSALTLSTFLAQHPLDTWDSAQTVQAVLLSLCLLTAALNSLVVSPIIVSAMLKTFKMEVEAGVGDVIGYADMKELKKNPLYFQSYRRFRRCHGVSAMLVLTSLVANTAYLYFLTALCLPL